MQKSFLISKMSEVPKLIQKVITSKYTHLEFKLSSVNQNVTHNQEEFVIKSEHWPNKH